MVDGGDRGEQSKRRHVVYYLRESRVRVIVRKGTRVMQFLMSMYPDAVQSDRNPLLNQNLERARQ